jgi:hypothetical protein
MARKLDGHTSLRYNRMFMLHGEVMLQFFLPELCNSDDISQLTVPSRPCICHMKNLSMNNYILFLASDLDSFCSDCRIVYRRIAVRRN